MISVSYTHLDVYKRQALAPKLLFDFALEMVRNDDELKKLSENIIQMAQHNSAERIVDEIEKLI